MVAALDAVSQVEFHVVAQIIEAELVVGAVGNIGAVSFTPFVIIQFVDNHANSEAEEVVDLAHPLGVAFGQIVVDGDDMNTASGQRIEINRQSGDQRFTFTGFHLGDLAFMQHHATDKLHVEVPHVEDPPTGLANYCKCLFENFVQNSFKHGIALRFVGGQRLFFGRFVGLSVRNPLLDPRPELRGFRAELLIRELLHLRLKRADALHSWREPFDFALILGAEYLGDDVCNQKRYPLWLVDFGSSYRAEKSIFKANTLDAGGSEESQRAVLSQIAELAGL